MFLTYTSASRPLALRSVYRQGPTLGQSFHWLEAGWDNDETIVLLHGLMAHSMAYRKVVPRLAPHYRLIIPDLPAHGRDQTFRSDDMEPKIDALVGWLGELLEVIDADRVHLVGHSLGALTSFMAARVPGRLAPVDSVTLVSPGIRIGVPPWLHHLFGRLPVRLARLGASSLGVRAYEPIQWRKSRMTSLEVDAYVQPFRQPDRLRFMMDVGVDLVRRPDRLVGAEHIDHRTLIMWGDKDHLLSVDTGHLLQASIDDARLEVIEGVGHCPMEDSPAEFVHLLRRFLGKS